jgi:hypothetical protein
MSRCFVNERFKTALLFAMSLQKRGDDMSGTVRTFAVPWRCLMTRLLSKILSVMLSACGTLFLAIV